MRFGNRADVSRRACGSAGTTRPDEYLDVVVREMLPRVAPEKLAEFCDVFCERGYFEIDQSRKFCPRPKSSDCKLRGHVDQLTNSGGAKLMAELGATTADHLEQTDEQGIAALKKANVQPVLVPGSVYALGSSRYPRAREMIAAGLAVVLATDFNPGSSPTPSMPMVLSIACTQMKMSPAEAITASTINAAYSLNRGDKIGSLESGKLRELRDLRLRRLSGVGVLVWIPPDALRLRPRRTRSPGSVGALRQPDAAARRP